MVVDGVLAEERRVEHLVLRPADRAEDRARPELAGERQVLLAEELLHQALLVVGVVDDEAAADPDRLAVAAQDAGTERVERAGLDVAAGLADEADDPLAELAGGPVRERDREDRPGPDVLDADEVGDPMGEDAGLAGAGAGEDQERALGRGDGPGLLGVQAPDDLLGAALRVRARGSPAAPPRAPPLVRRQLRRLLAGQRRVAQPVRLVGAGSGACPGRRRTRVPTALRGVVGHGCRTASGGSRDSPGHCRSGAFTRPHPGPGIDEPGAALRARTGWRWPCYGRRRWRAST